MNNPSQSSESRGDRLQKVLAAAGLGSRRGCEPLIVEGRVEVNGRIVTELGTRVDPNTDAIRVDGEALRTSRKRRYLLVNKPEGVVCTHRDPDGRRRVIDLVPGGETLFPIGRLDRSSQGLILLTDDGEFANAIAHPRNQVTKVYRVRVAGRPSFDLLAKLRKGIHLAEAYVRVDAVRVKRTHPKSTELEVELREGRNREIRRIFAKFGHKVEQLRRVAIGPLKLDRNFPKGAYRPLTTDEVRRLRQAAKPSKSPSKRRQKQAQESGQRQRPRSSAPRKLETNRSGPVLNLMAGEDER